jgi:hypothetical protein
LLNKYKFCALYERKLVTKEKIYFTPGKTARYLRLKGQGGGKNFPPPLEFFERQS